MLRGVQSCGVICSCVELCGVSSFYMVWFGVQWRGLV